MSVTVKAPFELKTLLAKMKSAKAQGVNMAVWDSEVAAVEDAIATIEGIRQIGSTLTPSPRGNRFCAHDDCPYPDCLVGSVCPSQPPSAPADGGAKP